MIKNVVFDIGQVLLRYEPEQYLLQAGFSNRDIGVLNKLVFSSSIWLELDRGGYTFSEAVDIIIAQNPGEETIIRRLFPLDWSALFQAKEDTVALMKDVKAKGYSVFILSNFSGEGYAYVEKTFDFLNIPDGKVISYQEKCVKPEDEIYRILLDRFSLIPEETVFFDDLPRNIEAANRCGIHGIVFTSAAAASANLEKIINSL